MMLKKKVLLISKPKLKKYYKKIITTYGSKLENIDENYSIFKKKIPKCFFFFQNFDKKKIIFFD